MAKIFATRNAEIDEREIRNMNRARKIAADGMVLLENDGTLPLKNNMRRLAAFGSGVRQTVKGGTGSGDVNSRFVVNVEQGLEDAGFEITSKPWLDRHEQSCKSHLDSYMAKLAALLQEKGPAGIAEVLADPYRDPDVPEITEEDIRTADAEIAVYVIARTSGEGSDRKVQPGDYELSERERQNLETLTAAYKKTIVILNIGGVIDTKYLRGLDGVGAILLMSQGGNVSGNALADILTGAVTPSGHLTATWAENYGDYPSAQTFSYMNGDVADEYYTEGIYVGYRYFDTFGIKPAYPFGFGRSYTAFSVTTDAVAVSGQDVAVQVSVTNTGTEYAGREVVQVYYSAPAGKLEKPYQELAAFAKTKVLAPGETQKLTVTFPIISMVSYDEEQAAYLLEKGLYYVRVGTHSRNTHIAAALSLGSTVMAEQLTNRICADTDFASLSAQNAVSYTYEGENHEKSAATVIDITNSVPPLQKTVYCGEPAVMHTDKETTITLDHVLAGQSTVEELTAQLSPEELAELCVGSARGGFGSTSIIGAASTACPGAAGDTTSCLLDKRGIPNLVLADGPAGLRLSRSFVADAHGNVIPGLGESAMGGIEQLFGMVPPERPEDAVDYYQYCTAIPIATMLAQTWDVQAVEDAGDIVGEEMEIFGVTLWLAPGMNIQRNPLCGRNFEYYSEDPLLSGAFAAADTRGVQKHPGCGTCIKHFALNNQEDNRSHCNSHCGERAIREIYLRGFEIAIKQSKPLSLMTSYNLLNGVHTANCYELVTSILRDEWDFDGIVMTDWGTTGGGDMNPAVDNKYGFSDAAGCIKAGNDLIMPGSQEDVDAILRSLNAKPGKAPCPITLAELQACAARILKLIAHCACERR